MVSRLSLLIACLLPVACGDATGAVAEDFLGQWDVNTKLVAASQAVNPTYKPGDIRIDVWTFAGTLGAASLTTKDGTINGQITGTAAVFETLIDTGLNLKMKIHIECFLNSSRSMKGTIKAEYYGTFDNYVGLDAWTFEALKR